MASWYEFEAAAPQIAAAGRRLLFQRGFGLGYLATVRRDGGPRVHPVNPLLLDGALYVFVVPSPKLDDLRRDGRYALHSAGGEKVVDEFYVFGRASEVADVARRDGVAAGFWGPVAEDHTLFELDVERALWGAYSKKAGWPPRYFLWPAPVDLNEIFEEQRQPS